MRFLYKIVASLGLVKRPEVGDVWYALDYLEDPWRDNTSESLVRIKEVKDGWVLYEYSSADDQYSEPEHLFVLGWRFYF